ncbi:hypothetical protein VB715_11970 [Crocosphaera sp. UHCC 0190]|uniref:hypothetical protein n=1 Tax=Crocosphaera sp. UHCC 0190 TaxID=3110246 RepID=UPI002B1FB388|nr:hypothetical protein [Crocosphaera sp. UHCC 0190]MEA5510482.1 hypothetical protein [Crocosphaera sp. UHCC 0190]
MKRLKSALILGIVISGTFAIALISNPVNAKTLDKNQSQLTQDWYNNCGNHDHEGHEQNSHPPKKGKS